MYKILIDEIDISKAVRMVFFNILKNEKPLFVFGHSCREEFIIDIDYLNWIIEENDMFSPSLSCAASVKLILETLDLPPKIKFIYIEV